MPKKNKKPTYLRHSSGQARVRIGGADIYLGLYGSEESYHRYNQILAEYRATGGALSRIKTKTNDITVAELIDRYWPYFKEKLNKQKGKKAQSHLYRVKAVLNQITRQYGTTPASEFGPLKLLVIRDGLIKKELTRTYINRLIEDVKQVWRWAAGVQELVPGDLIHKINCFPKLEPKESSAPESRTVLPVDEDLLTITLPYLNPIVRDMVEIQLWTGMRPGEICSLRPCDVKREGEVHLPGIGKMQLEGLWLYQPAEHKTERYGISRVILIGPKAQEILTPYLDRDPSKPCFSPKDVFEWWVQERAEKRQTPMTPSQEERHEQSLSRSRKRAWGNRYDEHSYRRAICRACAKADRLARKEKGDLREEVKKEERLIGSWHPNQLRHNAGTRLASQFGDDVARIVLGHTTMKMTRRYVVDDLRKAAEAIRQAG